MTKFCETGRAPTRHAPTRRALFAAAGAIAAALAASAAPRAQSAGVLTITIDEALEATYGVAEILVDDEPQGVLSAGCCMYIRVGPGDHILTLRWPDHEISAGFETDGDDAVAFHLTSQRTLTRLEE